MSDVDMIKCACADCVCVISVAKAVESHGKLFCGNSCAEGHVSGNGCGHVGCECHG